MVLFSCESFAINLSSKATGLVPRVQDILNFFISASLAFADILLGMVVVPFSLVQVCSISLLSLNTVYMFVGSFGTMDFWILLVPGIKQNELNCFLIDLFSLIR